MTAAAALETIDDIASRTYVCDGSYSIGGDTVVCQSDPGTYTLGQALMYSCNSAFAQIALEVGPAQLTATAKKLGITKSLSFDGYETASSSFDLSDAEDVEVAWAGIGQYHDQINPCQYMTLMGAIANGGSAKTPYFVQSVSYGGKVKRPGAMGGGGQGRPDRWQWRIPCARTDTPAHPAYRPPPCAPATGNAAPYFPAWALRRPATGKCTA